MRLSEAIKMTTIGTNLVIYSDLVDGRFNLDAPAWTGRSVLECEDIGDMLFFSDETDLTYAWVNWQDEDEPEDEYSVPFLEWYVDCVNDRNFS